MRPPPRGPRAPRKAHRPRTGKRRRATSENDTGTPAFHTSNNPGEEASRGAASVNPTAGEPIPAKTAPPRCSTFATLHRRLNDPAELAAVFAEVLDVETLNTNHPLTKDASSTNNPACTGGDAGARAAASSAGLTAIARGKLVNQLLQALSQRSAGLYEVIFREHRPAVRRLLEQLLSQSRTTGLTPSAQEFLLRCESAGLDKTSSDSREADEIETNPPPQVSEPTEAKSVKRKRKEGDRSSAQQHQAVPLWSLPELLRRLAVVDPVGRLRRQMELAEDVSGLWRCVNGLTKLCGDAFSSSARKEEHEHEASGEENENETLVCGPAVQLPPAVYGGLLRKWIARARRVFTVPAKTTLEETHTTASDPSAKEDLNENKNKQDDNHDHHHHDHYSAPEVHTLEETEKAIPELRALTASEHSRVQSLFHRVVSLFLQLWSTQPVAARAAVPLTEWRRFCEWATAHRLLRSADVEAVTWLLQDREAALPSAVTQLETVLRFKQLPNGPEGELRALVEELWQAGGGQTLSPSSADVLSSLATAAAAPAIGTETKRWVAERLVRTQRVMAKTDPTFQLPRRALRFVQAQRDEVRQALTAQHRATAEAAELNATQRIRYE